MKTISLKKVSAVAVASLGFGLMSVVPANATAQAATNTYLSSATLVNSSALTTAPTGTSYTKNLVVASDAITGFGLIAGSSVAFKLKAGAGAWSTGTTFRVKVNGATQASDLTLASGSGTATATTSAWATTYLTAGTNTVSITASGASGSFVAADLGETVSFTVTVTAAPGWSQGLTTVLKGDQAATITTTTDAGSLSAAKAAGTYVGSICVSVKNSAGTAYTGQGVTASVSGVGYVSGATIASCAQAAVAAATAWDGVGFTTATRYSTVSDSNGYVAFDVFGDGLAGTSTVAISITDQVTGATTAIATKSFTFYGLPTKVEISESIMKVGKAGGDTTGDATPGSRDGATPTTMPAFVVKATDANGNVAAITDVTSALKSDNTLAVSGGTCALDDDATTYSSGGVGYYNCNFATTAGSKSGDKATITFKVLNENDPTGLTYLTATYAVTVGGSVAKEVLTTDKTTYAPGELMKVTVTATDSAGNPVYDGATSVAAVASNKSAVGLPSVASFYVAGKKTWGSLGGVYAPALPGAFSLSAVGTDTATTVITASATVTDWNAGLTTMVDALNAKIVALNALIAKIMKKLGVK